MVSLHGLLNLLGSIACLILCALLTQPAWEQPRAVYIRVEQATLYMRA